MSNENIYYAYYISCCHEWIPVKNQLKAEIVDFDGQIQEEWSIMMGMAGQELELLGTFHPQSGNRVVGRGRPFSPVTRVLQKDSTSGRNCIIDWGPHIQTHEPVGGISNSIYKTCHQNSEIYETVCSYILLFSWKCWLMLISTKDTPRTNYKSVIVMLTSLSYILLLTLIKDLNFF